MLKAESLCPSLPQTDRASLHRASAQPFPAQSNTLFCMKSSVKWTVKQWDRQKWSKYRPCPQQQQTGWELSASPSWTLWRRPTCTSTAKGLSLMFFSPEAKSRISKELNILLGLSSPLRPKLTLISSSILFAGHRWRVSAQAARRHLPWASAAQCHSCALKGCSSKTGNTIKPVLTIINLSLSFPHIPKSWATWQKS